MKKLTQANETTYCDRTGTSTPDSTTALPPIAAVRLLDSRRAAFDPKQPFASTYDFGSQDIVAVSTFYLGRDLQKRWKTDLLENGSISLIVFYILIVNVLLFFVLGVLFDGAAFPYGKIDGARYWIVNNAGTREISATWFWFTYWQGLSAWMGIGLTIGAFAFIDLLRNSWGGALKKVVSRIAIVIGMSVWLFMSVLSAMEIAQV